LLQLFRPCKLRALQQKENDWANRRANRSGAAIAGLPARTGPTTGSTAKKYLEVLLSLHVSRLPSPEYLLPGYARQRCNNIVRYLTVV